MNTDARFNRILNNLDKVIGKNGGNQTQPRYTERDYTEWAVKRINALLETGEQVEIKNNRLKLKETNNADSL